MSSLRHAQLKWDVEVQDGIVLAKGMFTRLMTSRTRVTISQTAKVPFNMLTVFLCVFPNHNY